MEAIRRKVFVGPTLYWGFKPLNYYRDKIRDAAEAFINEVVGHEQLISVNEFVTSNGPFTVVVWFRTDAAVASETITFTTAMLTEPRGFELL